MGVHQFNSLARYIRFLQENPQEVELLNKELLIGVTNFFRDPGMYDFLKEKALPHLLQTRPVHGPLRVWNPGCSTGEETYSLAIALKECLEGLKLEDTPTIQIFATDIDQEAIDKARRGKFPAGIATDVSPERLERFFVQEDLGYQIKKEVRDLVVFAAQNILVDPPFTKVDILCCRNLLIYVNARPEKAPAALSLRLESRRTVWSWAPGKTSGFGHLFSPWTRGGRSSSASRGETARYRNAGVRAAPRTSSASVIEKGKEPEWTYSTRPSGCSWMLRPSLRGGQC